MHILFVNLQGDMHVYESKSLAENKEVNFLPMSSIFAWKMTEEWGLAKERGLTFFVSYWMRSSGRMLLQVILSQQDTEWWKGEERNSWSSVTRTVCIIGLYCNIRKKRVKRKFKGRDSWVFLCVLSIFFKSLLCSLITATFLTCCILALFFPWLQQGN